MRQTLFAFTFLAAATILSSFAIITVEEYGKAGYYADSLQGRKTASGEKYDKNEYTCAHKSLPFGTKIRITRIDNKKSVVVRVNDRGPFVEGYVVDVSRAAAEEIGLVRDGVTRVRVDVVEAVTTSRVAAETNGNTNLLISQNNAKLGAKGLTATSKSVNPAVYNTTGPTAAAGGKTTTELLKVDLKKPEKIGFGVQVSTLTDANNVLPEVKKLQTQWAGKALVLTEKNDLENSIKYKLIIGPYEDKKSADVQQKLAVKKGYKGCFVVDLSTL